MRPKTIESESSPLQQYIPYKRTNNQPGCTGSFYVDMQLIKRKWFRRILNKNLMNMGMYNATEMQIFIHHPGQLIRSLAIPSFTSSFQDYQHNKQLSFKMAQTTMIRKRPDYNDPCNSAMQDYDKYLMNVVINETGCIPPYWKEIVQDIPRFTVCSSQEQLQMVYENIKDFLLLINFRCSEKATQI